MVGLVIGLFLGVCIGIFIATSVKWQKTQRQVAYRAGQQNIIERIKEQHHWDHGDDAA